MAGCFFLAAIIGAIIGVILTPHLFVYILGLLGFAAIGPVAGMFAAWVQAWIGNVPAGGLFAILQGIAMGAPIPAICYAIVAIVFGIVGAALAALF